MKTISVNQDTLVSLTCNFCGFVVAGIYDDGLMLKAAKSKKDKETLIDRMIRLNAVFHQLGMNVKVTKLASMQDQIEVRILD